MRSMSEVAPAFVSMAHQIVWCSAATVDEDGRPRSRVLHPIWEWSDGNLTGWIATGPTPLKRAHLAAHPYLSCNYWSPSQDTCVAECTAEWCFDIETRKRVWDLLANGPVDSCGSVETDRFEFHAAAARPKHRLLCSEHSVLCL